MVIRRTHTKSRRGCVQCKKNRTKCDEQKPRCGRCARREEACSFLTSASSLTTVPTPQSATSPNKSPVRPELTLSTAGAIESLIPKHPQHESINLDGDLVHRGFADVERDHLRLMNHYAHFTCKEITDLTFGNGEGLPVWRDYALQLAFENDFLLHGVLGISALQLALSQPSLKLKYAVLAVRQHDLGITQFRPYLTDIVADKVDALFAFSCITALYSFGIHRTGQYRLSPLAKIHEVFGLIRGTGGIVKTNFHWLKQGPWSGMLLQENPDLTQELSKELEMMLAELSRRVHTTIAATQQSDIYFGAIAALRQNFLQATTRLHMTTTLVFFPIRVHSEFLKLLCIGEPLALAILANYAVILHWLRRHIWLDGWGKEVVDAVHQNLPPDWHKCIDWATNETCGSDEI